VEIVVPGDFEALLRRLHPAASRVERLSVEKPASLTFVGDDVLRRVERDGDLFEPVLTLEQELPAL